MYSRDELKRQVTIAAQEQGINSVLLRNAVSRKLGLSVTDMECLSLLFAKGFSTPKELARYTGMTPGSATAMLDRLEKANFVRRKPNPNDRRGVLIEIDEQSLKRVSSMFAAARQSQDDLMETYSDSELEIIAGFMTRLADTTKKHKKLLEEDSTQNRD
jgi:DNA-binding MarR family transcriptional regulator